MVFLNKFNKKHWLMFCFLKFFTFQAVCGLFLVNIFLFLFPQTRNDNPPLLKINEFVSLLQHFIYRNFSADFCMTAPPTHAVCR